MERVCDINGSSKKLKCLAEGEDGGGREIKK